MSLKELIKVMNPHIKGPGIMMIVKSKSFYFVKAHELLIKVIVCGNLNDSHVGGT
jgi:hypothetical protein